MRCYRDTVGLLAKRKTAVRLKELCKGTGVQKVLRKLVIEKEILQRGMVAQYRVQS